MFKFHEAIAWQEGADLGVETAEIVAGDGLRMRMKRFEAGGVEQLHVEDVPVAGYVLEGRFQVLVEGEGTNLGTGDAFTLPAGTKYGVRALTAGRLLEVLAESGDGERRT